jgi:ketosteroid isomerase-like protein
MIFNLILWRINMEPSLEAIMQRWAAAAAAADINVLDEIIDDDFVRTSPKGALENKADYLEKYRGLRQRHVIIDELSCKLFGDVAVVFGRSVQDSVNTEEQVTTRYTDVFVKCDSLWRCVAAHGSRVG